MVIQLKHLLWNTTVKQKCAEVFLWQPRSSGSALKAFSIKSYSLVNLLKTFLECSILACIENRQSFTNIINGQGNRLTQVTQASAIYTKTYMCYWQHQQRHLSNLLQCSSSLTLWTGMSKHLHGPVRTMCAYNEHLQ